MWLLQVRIRTRELTPEQGQAALEEILKEADKNQNSGGFRPIKIDGVTIHKNPFEPYPWLVSALKMGIPGLVFEDINYTYQATFIGREDAQLACDWIHKNLVAWAENSPEKLEVLSRTESRVMDASDDTQGLDSF